MVYTGYGAFVVIACICLVIANLILQTRDYNIVGFISMAVNCFNIACISISSCVSAHIIYKVSKRTTGFSETFNSKMFYINFCFCILFGLSEVVFLVAIGRGITTALIIGIYTYEYLRITIELMILYLASVYGEQMSVTSTVNSQGDLVISGGNEVKREFFKFTK